MAYTYPAPAPTVSGDYLTIHVLLQSPTLIARRLRTLAQQRFISDALLTGRYPVSGGAIRYEQEESMYTDRTPEVVRPGAEYPLTGLGLGPSQVAEVQKWGQDVPVTDEAIKRLIRNPVDRAFIKLVNQMVKQVDSVALSVIASTVTTSVNARAAWNGTTVKAKDIFLDVGLAKANILALNQGYDPDTVVVDDVSWTYAISSFVDAGYLPREAAAGAVQTGTFPIIEGMQWLASPNIPVGGAALVLDSTQLGGMADEQLGGPGYVGVDQAGVETKSIRDEDNDMYRLRCRRLTVPIVIEPRAATKVLGISA